MVKNGSTDLIIQNFGAVRTGKVVGKMEIAKESKMSCERYTITEIRGFIEEMFEKFKKKELEEKDFESILSSFDAVDENGNLSKHTACEKPEMDLDKILPVEYELDFEDGEIKVTETSAKDEKITKVQEKDQRKEGKAKSGKSQDDKQINKQMKQLMETFEQEKKNLQRKVELEKELIAKKVADDYERKLKVEKDFLGAVIADLVKSVEDARSQVEELQMIREHDRMTLQKFFKRKLADERKRIMLELVARDGRA